MLEGYGCTCLKGTGTHVFKEEGDHVLQQIIICPEEILFLFAWQILNYQFDPQREYWTS